VRACPSVDLSSPVVPPKYRREVQEKAQSKVMAGKASFFTYGFESYERALIPL
jgi:hypothetical protein